MGRPCKTLNTCVKAGHYVSSEHQGNCGCLSFDLASVACSSNMPQHAEKLASLGSFVCTRHVGLDVREKAGTTTKAVTQLPNKSYSFS